MKTIDTLIDDVVDLAEKGVDVKRHQSSIDKFSKNMRELIEEFLSKKEKNKEKFKLRMSALGTPARKLWYQKNTIDDLDTFSGSHLIKFFYGHMIEELVCIIWSFLLFHLFFKLITWFLIRLVNVSAEYAFFETEFRGNGISVYSVYSVYSV